MMPRVQIQPAALSALCATCFAFAACAGGGGGPQLSVDEGSVNVPDDFEGSGAQPKPLGAPIDGPEETPAACQSQFYGADPLASEQSARSCSYTLASSVLNPANVVVKVASQARASGNDEDGWLLVDGTTVLLLGLACDDVLAGADLELSVLCE